MPAPTRQASNNLIVRGSAGIGVTSPAAILDVTTNGSSAGFRVSNGSLTYMAANGGTPNIWTNNGLTLSATAGAYMLDVDGDSYFQSTVYLGTSNPLMRRDLSTAQIAQSTKSCGSRFVSHITH